MKPTSDISDTSVIKVGTIMIVVILAIAITVAIATGRVDQSSSDDQNSPMVGKQVGFVKSFLDDSQLYSGYLLRNRDYYLHDERSNTCYFVTETWRGFGREFERVLKQIECDGKFKSEIAVQRREFRGD